MTSLAKVIGGGGGRGTRTPEGRIIIVGNTFPWTSPNTRGGGGGDGRVKELGVGGGGARGETVGTVDSRGGGGGGDKTGKWRDVVRTRRRRRPGAPIPNPMAAATSGWYDAISRYRGRSY